MKYNNISLRWSFILPNKNDTICTFIGAKRLKDFAYDPSHEMYFYSYRKEVAITPKNREDYLNAVVCTKCKLFLEVHPNYNMDYDMLYNDGGGCTFSLKSTVTTLVNMGGEKVAKQCLKSRDPKGLMDLATLIEVFISDTRKREGRTIINDMFLRELETVVKWLRTVAKYGVSLNVS